MAGARSYTFRISAEGVDAFARDLGQLGQQSDVAQRALDRLLQSSPSLAGALTRAGAATDAATDRLANLDRRVRGAGEAHDEASGRVGKLGQALGQAGFQMQDFAVQVQSGTSYLTALSQQGSQFLGLFGTGGAIAGAVLTVGLLAAQFLGLKDATEEVSRSNELWKSSVADLNALFETATERAARLREESVRSVIAAQGAIQATAQQRVETLSGQVLQLEEQLRYAEQRRDATAPGGLAARAVERTVTELQGRLASLRGDADAARREVEATQAIIDKAKNAGRLTGDEYGPPAPEREKPARAVRASINRDEEREIAAAQKLQASWDDFWEKAEGKADTRAGDRARRDREALDVQGQQLDSLRAEGRLLGGNVSVRARELAILKERQAILREGGNLEALTEEQKRRIENAGLIADETAALQRQRDAMGDLQRIGETAFDRLGTAISTAFASGSAKALDFGSIVRSVLASIASDAVKLGLVRPISNAVFGGNSSTLWDSFGGAGGSAGGGSGGFDLGSLMRLGNAANQASGGSLYSTIGGWFGGGGSSVAAPSIAGTSGDAAMMSLPMYPTAASTGVSALGASGVAGTGSGFVSSAGSVMQFGSMVNTLSGGSLYSGIGSMLGFGGAASVAAPSIAGMSSGAALASLPAVPTAASTGVAALGANGVAGTGTGFVSASGAGAGASGMLAAAAPYAGGLALGMGLGSMVGGGMMGKVDATRNSAIGSGIGMAIGAFFGPVGALIGGALGGLVGSMFGPSKKGLENRSGGDVTYGVQNGRLVVLSGRGKRWDQAASMGAVQQQLDTANDAAAARGLAFDESYGGVIGFGKASKNPHELSEADLVRSLRGGTAPVQTALYTLGTRGAGLNDAFAAVDWVKNTFEPATSGASDFARQLQAIRDQWEPLIVKARDLGIAEDGLTAARDKQLAALEAEKAAKLRGIDAELTARLATARGDSRGASLVTFDERVIEERETYRQQLENLGVATEEVTSRLARLAEVTEAERAALLDAPRQQGAGTAAGVVRSLGNYASSLLLGGGSTLTAEQQYQYAAGRFNETAARAQAGDLAAAGQLQTYSEALLATSRNFNGSGTGYNADFNRVVSVLEQFGRSNADALTQSAMNATIEKQTDVLQRELAALRAINEALLRQSQLNALVPVRA